MEMEKEKIYIKQIGSVYYVLEEKGEANIKTHATCFDLDFAKKVKGLLLHSPTKKKSKLKKQR